MVVANQDHEMPLPYLSIQNFLVGLTLLDNWVGLQTKVKSDLTDCFITFDTIGVNNMVRLMANLHLDYTRREALIIDEKVDSA